MKSIKLLPIVATLFSCGLTFADAQSDLEVEKKLGAEYLTNMAKEPNAQVIDQGIVIRPVFVSDSQTFPTITDTVQVAYHLMDREGKLIEESISSDELVEFPLGKLIKCWQIAVPKISIGSFYKITCPSDTAYGDKGAGPDIKPGAALTFRLTVYGVKK